MSSTIVHKSLESVLEVLNDEKVIISYKTKLFNKIHKYT